MALPEGGSAGPGEPPVRSGKTAVYSGGSGISGKQIEGNSDLAGWKTWGKLSESPRRGKIKTLDGVALVS